MHQLFFPFRHKFLVLMLLLCSSFMAFGQGKNWKAEMSALVQDIGSKYEDCDMALLLSKEVVKFGINKAAGLITVTETIDYDYLGLKGNTDFYFVRFYDETSEIKDIALRDYMKRKIRVQEKDEYYKDKDIFHSDARVKYIKIDPPKGEVYFLKNTKYYSDAKYFTKSHFTSHVPIVEKVIEYIVPSGIDVEFKEYNFKGYDIQKTETTKKSGEKIYRYVLNDIPPAPKEKNSAGSAHFLPHILVLPKSYTDNSGKKVVFEKTKDLYNWYRNLVLQMENDASEIESLVSILTANAKDDIEKVKQLYYWVQDNIRYIAFEDGIAGFKPDECQNVFKKKYGDCKGMANLLKEMLIVAGFDARLTWIGTSHIPYDYSTPSLAVDNHMICTLLLNDKKYYLDPTEKFNPFAYNASRIQGKQVMIEAGDDFIIETVPTFDHTSNSEVVVWKNLKIEDEQLAGKGSSKYEGERLTEVLYGFNNIKSEERNSAIKRLITGRDKNFLVSNVTHTDPDDRDQAFVVDYEIRLNNMVSSFENELYLELDYYKEFNKSIFKERKTDFVFDYRFNMKNILEVEIPAGYAIQELPEGLHIENEYFSIKTTVDQRDRAILYEKTIQFKKTKIPKTAFDTWNAGFEKLGAFYQEQVILSKE